MVNRYKWKVKLAQSAVEIKNQQPKTVTQIRPSPDRPVGVSCSSEWCEGCSPSWSSNATFILIDFWGEDEGDKASGVGVPTETEGTRECRGVERGVPIELPESSWNRGENTVDMIQCSILPSHEGPISYQWSLFNYFKVYRRGIWTVSYRIDVVLFSAFWNVEYLVSLPKERTNWLTGHWLFSKKMGIDLQNKINHRKFWYFHSRLSSVYCHLAWIQNSGRTSFKNM